jgi:DNA repair protein RecO (recombination protein O)
MRIHTRGIVLQTTNYSETSLVVKIYTEQSGLTSFIVGGVRTKNSRFKSNLFQPLTLVEIIASGKPGAMARITEVQLAPPFTSIPANLIKSSVAIFLAEVIYRSIKEEEANPLLFAFLNNGIQILDLTHHNCSRFHIFFMLQLTRYLGFYPNGAFSKGSCFDLREGLFITTLTTHGDVMDQQLTAAMHQLLNSSFENYHEVEIAGNVSRQLLKAMVKYFELHQTHGSAIKSHKVLEEVLG